MRKIFIALPAGSWTVFTPTLRSIVNTISEIHANGWTYHLQCLDGDSDLPRARNVLLGLCYASDCTDMLCIDADNSWQQGEFTRVMSHAVDFVAGAYRMKTDQEEIYPVHWPEQRAIHVDVQSGQPLLEAELVPGGFWRLSRRCVEIMCNAAQKPWRTDVRFPGTVYPKVFHHALPIDDDGMVELSEDFSFCYKWRKLGHKIYVDPALRIDHTGVKIFDGDLYGMLTKQAQQNNPLIGRGSVAQRARAAIGL